MKAKTLTPEQVEQFVRDGYVVVPGAFAREAAEAIVPLAFAASPFDIADHSTWDRAIHVVQKSLTGGPADEIYTPTVMGAMNDLLGEGRYPFRNGTGYLVFNMPGFAEPPWRAVGEHVDGIHFQHHLDSPDQGLVLLFLFTDLKAGGGGTAIRVGSHHATARVLAEAEPDGLNCGQLSGKVMEACEGLQTIEAVGEAGDLLIMHPFTLHGSSSNLSEAPRIASNMCITLNEKMNFNRPDAAEYSPVEQAILEALATTAAG